MSPASFKVPERACLGPGTRDDGGPLIGLFASFGHLTLALLVMSRRSKNPMTLPLVLLCLDMFAWNFATAAHRFSGDPTWHRIDIIFSPFTPPLAFHLVLCFLGRLRSQRRLLIASYIFYGLLSASAALAFAVSAIGEWADSTGWSLAFLGGWAPLMLLMLWWLGRHLRGSVVAEERANTWLMIAALVIGGTLGSADVWRQLTGGPYSLSSLGTLGSTALLTMVVVRFRSLGRDVSTSGTVYALALGLLGMAGYLVVFRVLAANTGALLLGTATVTLALLAATREVVASVSVRRERRQHLEGMGRFSAQLAHDLKNPLAAMKGAVQYLVEESEQGGSLAEQREFLELMGDQVERIRSAIDKYQRLARVEPSFESLDVNAVVRDVLGLQKFAAGERIAIEIELTEELPPCLGDRDLIASGIERLVENAFEAMPTGGTVRVRTSNATLGQRGDVMITVIDQGMGMDPRAKERALVSFFTTKPTGTGLGLAHVRHVVEAHDGELFVTTRPGVGTIIGFTLPGA